MSTPLLGLVDERLDGDTLWGEAHREHKRLKEIRQELAQMRLGFAAIANTFHEVRTLLHSMSGFIKLMLESKVEESMGADDYMTKPVGPSEILTKVETMLASGSKVVHGQS